MPTIGFHCSHEQIPPSQLLEDVKHAEAAGFTAAMCSATSSRGARTRASRACVVLARCCTQRDQPALRRGHCTGPAVPPVITAQAIGTLGEMFPGRFWAAWAPARPSTST